MTGTLALPWLADERIRCFGCSPHNPDGLALAVRRLPDGRTGAWFTVPERFASYPGIVHGGVIGAVVDEVMGTLVAVERGRLTFCATLRTRMLAPLHTGRRYLVTARLLSGTAGDTGRTTVRAEADVSDVDGAVRVAASGTYTPIRAEEARDLGLDAAGFAALQPYFDHQRGTSS
ncbi:thioesterase [Virgisporangium aliadipatigenens]|uniref:Thioesterase n=1 Tax=Virgisporangium aliadipatigenens TaxID=741659 RepID=A0A8J3YGP5_9ACTN|nr:PaaI family thioesterase [Virgisporangium aliadipatigenens]GIJ43673.1 thioesterase [Virgisporangium aliadipatigenens]